ncbi:MAG TPA: GGDEF domain-containing protein [Baekduia sp.]|uniref:GGDEF domain-containing protein n=1 Tax=Baekduia sp. TaxID=2600305 RepID=UPI002C9FC8F0|nr:GGDEF domain-containing protein [Baekduia sp.]HMJ33342.1 GGDEF domain-containing protein [Baekduia sp.]
MGSHPETGLDLPRLRALLHQAPDHYEILDRRFVGRLAGFLFWCAGLIAAALLAFDPPTSALGGLGWVPAAITVGLAFVFGGAMVVTQRTLGTGMLMAIALSGPLMLGMLQWLAGSASSYDQLVILSVVWCGVVLPARRLLLLLLADTVVVFLPAAYGDWSAGLLPERIATLAIAWALALLCFVWSGHIRNIRRTLDAERAAADELARVDALTGLGNRRALDEALVGQVALSHRTGRPIAALVGDLDGFKFINDVHGHHTGDRLLRDVAAVLRQVVRSPDACFRWGGDEFVVLLGEADMAEAHEVADRIARAIRVRCATPDGTPVTMTLGAAAHAEGTIGAELLADADADLLVAKSGSRAA